MNDPLWKDSSREIIVPQLQLPMFCDLIQKKKSIQLFCHIFFFSLTADCLLGSIQNSISVFNYR